MSRTTRKTFYDIRPGLRRENIQEWTGYRGKTIERDRYINGRDGVRGSFGEPFGDSPKGFEPWCDREGNSRWAKRGAARVIRNRYKKIIREEVRLLEAGDDEVIYRRRSTKQNKEASQAFHQRSREEAALRSNCVSSRSDSKISVPSLLKRHLLSVEVDLMKRQMEDLLKVRVHPSLLSSLQEEVDTLADRINRAQYRISSIRR